MGHAIGLFRRLALTALWVGLLLVSPSPGELRAQPSFPAEAQTQPGGDEGAVPSAGALPELKQAARVEEATAFTEAERNVLSSVHDGGGWDHTAFYVLLRRAAMLPGDLKTIEAAQRIDPKDLWDNPQRYRGRLISLEGKIPRPVTEWTKRLTLTRWWGARPVYMVDILESTTGQPMLVAMTTKPHQGIFLNQKLAFAGFFYKNVALATATQPDQPREFPLVVANQFYRPRASLGSDLSWKVALGISLVVVLVVAFLMIQRHLYKPVKLTPGASLRRQRQQAQRRPVPAEPAQPQPVDEELARQVRRFQEDQDKRARDKHDEHQNNQG